MNGRSWTAAELRSALSRYEAEAMASTLALNTQNTYVIHARRFVDWLEGGYRFPLPSKTSGDQV